MLHCAHGVLIALALMYENVVFDFNFSGCLVWLAILFPYLRWFYRTATGLFYSFWTFVALTLFFLLYKLITLSGVYGLEVASYLYVLAGILLFIESYFLSSPIYFPRVSWWEYDFRFKDDLRVMATLEGNKEVHGRLTDLRRGAGCVVLFELLELGSKIDVSLNSGNETLSISGEVISHRDVLVGRGHTYGVRFEESPKVYEKFVSLWSKERILKQKRKHFLKKEINVQ